MNSVKLLRQSSEFETQTDLLKFKVRQLEVDKLEYVSQFRALSSEKEVAAAGLTNLTASLNSVTLLCETSNGDAKKLKVQLEKCSSDLANKSAAVMRLESQLNESQKQVEKLTARAEHLRIASEAHQSQQNHLLAESQLLKERAEFLNRSLTTAESKLELGLKEQDTRHAVKLKIHEDLVVELRGSIQQRDASILSLSGRVGFVTQELAKSNEQVGRADGTLLERSTECDRLKQTLSHLQSSISGISGEKLELEKQLGALKRTLEEDVRKRAELQQTHEATTASLANSHRTVVSLENQLTEVSRQLHLQFEQSTREMHSNHVQDRLELTQNIQRLESAIKAKEDSANTAAASLHRCTIDVATLKLLVEEKKNALIVANEENIKVRLELATCQSNCRECQVSLAEADGALKNCQQQLSVKTAEVEDARREFVQLQESSVNSTATVERLRAEINQKTAEWVELSKRRDTEKKKLEGLMEESNFQKELQESQKCALQQEISEAKVELDECHVQLEQKSAEIVRMQAKIATLDQSLLGLTETLHGAQQDRDLLRSASHGHASTVDQLKGELRAKTGAADRMNGELHVNREEAARLRNELEQKCEEAASLAKDLSGKRAEIGRLKAEKHEQMLTAKRLQLNLCEQEDACIKLKQNLNTETSRGANLKEEAQSLSVESTQNHSNFVAMEQSFLRLKRDYESKERDAFTLKSQLDERNVANARLKADEQGLKEQVKSMAALLHAKEREVLELEKGAERSRAEQLSTVSVDETIQRRHLHTISQHQTEIERLQFEVTEAKNKIASLERQLLSNSHTTSQSHHASLSHLTHQFQEASAVLEGRLETSEVARTQLSLQIEELSRQSTAATDSNDAVQQQLVNGEKELDTLRHCYNLLLTKNTNIDGLFTLIESHSKWHSKRMEEQLGSCMRLFLQRAEFHSTRICTMSSHLKSLALNFQRRRTAFEQQQCDLLARVRTLEADAGVLIANHKETETLSGKLNVENARLQSQLHQLDQESQIKTRHLVSIKSDLVSLKAEVRQLRHLRNGFRLQLHRSNSSSADKSLEIARLESLVASFADRSASDVAPDIDEIIRAEVECRISLFILSSSSLSSLNFNRKSAHTTTYSTFRFLPPPPPAPHPPNICWTRWRNFFNSSATTNSSTTPPTNNLHKKHKNSRISSNVHRLPRKHSKVNWMMWRDSTPSLRRWNLNSSKSTTSCAILSTI